MQLSVIELFAGVGGFRKGLEETGNFKVVWSNQYEPSTKIQHASMVYENEEAELIREALELYKKKP